MNRWVVLEAFGMLSCSLRACPGFLAVYVDGSVYVCRWMGARGGRGMGLGMPQVVRE